jgi:hypothetical protein
MLFELSRFVPPKTLSFFVKDETGTSFLAEAFAF